MVPVPLTFESACRESENLRSFTEGNQGNEEGVYWSLPGRLKTGVTRTADFQVGESCDLCRLKTGATRCTEFPVVRRASIACRGCSPAMLPQRSRSAAELHGRTKLPGPNHKK